MTSNSDFSPEDVRKAQALAPQLDPDMAQAIAQGNGPVIQAIASGATTTAQIADMLIRQGNTTGLPPGLQQLVDEQKRQNDEKKHDAEPARAERLDKLASGAFGMGQTGGEANGQTGSSGSSGVKSWVEMTVTEKSAYFGALAGMSYEDYARQSEPARQQHIDNVKYDSVAEAEKAKQDMAEFPAKVLADGALGATPEERQAAMERIYKAADYNKKKAEFLESLKGLSKAEREWAIELRDIYNREKFNTDAYEKGDNAQDAKNKGHTKREHEKITDAADDKQQPALKKQQYKDFAAALDRVEQNATAYGHADPAQHQQIVRSSDNAALQGHKLASTTGEKAHLAQAVRTEQQARTNERATIAAASLQAASGDGGFGADEPAPVVAQAEERHTIDLDRFKTSGMVQLPGVTAQIASAQPDPNPAEQKPQKPEGPSPSGSGTPA